MMNMPKLTGTYRGNKYEIDKYGYGYKIFNKDGSHGKFQPYHGNEVFDMARVEDRIKSMRKQLYNAVDRELYKSKNKRR